MGPILDPAGRAHSRRNPTAREDPGIQHDPEHKNAYQYEQFHQTILSVYGQMSCAFAVNIRPLGDLHIDVGQSFSLFKEAGGESMLQQECFAVREFIRCLYPHEKSVVSY